MSDLIQTEYFTPSNIFEWRDRQYRAQKGYLTFRLYEDGWLVRFTPHATQQINGQWCDAEGNPVKPDKIEGMDVLTA